MTWEIKRVPLLPVMKVGFFVFFVLSLIGFLFYALFVSSIIGGMNQLLGMNQQFDIPTITGGAMLFIGFFAAVFAAVVNTIVVLIAALIYNAIASFIGGIHVDLREVSGFPMAPAAPIGHTATTSASVAPGATPPPPPAEPAGETPRVEPPVDD